MCLPQILCSSNFYLLQTCLPLVFGGSVLSLCSHPHPTHNTAAFSQKNINIAAYVAFFWEN